MNVARQRLLNILAGVGFALLGCLCYGVAAYLAFVPPKPIGEAPLTGAGLAACRTTLNRLGFEVKPSTTELRAQRQGIDNAERSLADASIGISACGLPLVRFCMGPGCKSPAIPNGIFFALSTQENLNAGTDSAEAAVRLPSTKM